MSDTFTVRYSELRISFYARVDEEREERKGGRERERLWDINVLPNQRKHRAR